MKADVAGKWIGALLSGEFPQAKDALHNKDGFCCLGVLCELYRREHPERGTWGRPRDKGVIPFETERDAGFSVLPRDVKEWAGLISDTGGFDSDEPTLAELNDGGVTFASIANVIRENVARL